jgi:hypothetical protein
LDRKEYEKERMRRRMLFLKEQEDRKALRRFAEKITKVPETVRRYV